MITNTLRLEIGQIFHLSFIKNNIKLHLTIFSYVSDNMNSIQVFPYKQMNLNHLLKIITWFFQPKLKLFFQ